MRVKKLNANRRARAGDDDGSSATGSPQQIHSPSQWVSPTKTAYSPTREHSSATTTTFGRVDTREIGADSPTDPTAAPPVLQSHDVSDLDLTRHCHSPPTTAMANTTTPPTTTNANGSNAPSESSDIMTWREDVDRAVRESVHQKIVDYLSTLKPNAPPKVLEKLPGLAYRMEEALFFMATSETEYKDQTTLPQRLTLIQQANAKRLLQQQCPVVSPKDKDSAAQRTHKPLNEEHARVVFSCLQSWRQKLVNMYGATPWDILPNKLLAKIAVYIPSTTQELVVCGVADEQLERFGKSLLQEIEKVMNALNANASAAAAQQLHAAMNASRTSSPSGTKRPTSTLSKSANNGQATAKGRVDHTANKKRKTAAEISGIRLTPHTYLSAASFIAPTPALIRPLDPAFLAAAAAASSLPALLPSGSTTSATKTPPFFPRIPAPGSTLDQDTNNRMHLLAQGVGQLSQQQENHHQQQQQKQQDSEKEIQALRWMLQESQREKAMLEAEVQRLRQQGAK